jgi:hypothetical protein
VVDLPLRAQVQVSELQSQLEQLQVELDQRDKDTLELAQVHPHHLACIISCNRPEGTTRIKELTVTPD